MQYDFNKVISRKNTGSIKWHAPIIGGDDVLPLWVADMDLPCPGPVTDALRERLDHPLFGYTLATDGLKEAVTGWIKNRYGWEVSPEWLVFAPGVIPSVKVCIKRLLSPGGSVVIQPPVYPPFFDAAVSCGCVTAVNPLIRDGGCGMDVDGLEKLFGSIGGNGIFLLCSPHNPVGRVWTRPELERAAGIVIRNGGYIISDEIHADIVHDGGRHIPTASLAPEIAARTVTCLSTSKTFNLAGLQTSVMVIPDAGIREKICSARGHLYEGPNVLGLTAMKAAYRHGEEWLDQLLAYLAGNLDFMESFIRQNLPGISMTRPEGTYLVWLDFSGLGMDDEALTALLRGTARVYLNDGPSFGPGGGGFKRINIACPRPILHEALERIAAALKTR